MPDIQQLLQNHLALYPSDIGPIAPSSRSHHDHNEDKEVEVEKEEETKGKEEPALIKFQSMLKLVRRRRHQLSMN
jgi:hypothetical protein